MAQLPVIGALWMEGPLSYLEQLCLKSFVDAGHKVVLYHYGPLENVPEGIELGDANDFLPQTNFLQHERTGSPALHSDLFRYKMLEKSDNVIWADTDAYCMRPFETKTGHYFGWESDKHINGGVLGLPKDSDALKALLEFTSDEFSIPSYYGEKYQAELEQKKAEGTPVHASEQPWGVWGPHAVSHFLHQTGEEKYAFPQEVLYPFTFKDRRIMLKRDVDVSPYVTDKTTSVHLYGRRMRMRLIEKEGGAPHPKSFLASLLRKHDIDPAKAPIMTRHKPQVDDGAAKDTAAKDTAAKDNKAKPSDPAQGLVIGDPAFMARIGLEALKGDKSFGQVAKEFKVDNKLVRACRDRIRDHASDLFVPVDVGGVSASDLMANYIHRRHFLQTANLSAFTPPGSKFLFMKTSKAACSTVMATLIRQMARARGDEGNGVMETLNSVHSPPANLVMSGLKALNEQMIMDALADPDVFKFTVIRDPISRTVSAWADKIDGNEKEKGRLMRYLGRDENSNITLKQFIALLAEDEGARDLDRHWRLQRKETSYDLIDYDYIGLVEEMDAAMEKIVGTCFGTEAAGEIVDTRRTLGHKTKSSELIKTLSAKDLKNLEKAFGPDFEMYEEVKARLSQSAAA
jgi:hypothetical protein